MANGMHTVFEKHFNGVSIVRHTPVTFPQYPSLIIDAIEIILIKIER